MILMVHGYGLSGSGSNLWTRSVVRALCMQGIDVHLLCQDRRTESYPFIGAAYEYRPDGSRHTLFERDVETPGTCTMHRVSLDVLPVFVRPAAGTTGMASILDMQEDAVEQYLSRNVRALRQILATHDVRAVHVNHVVLMAVAVMRACREAEVPFGVMPHGSAIEYVVRNDDRMHALATEALTAADRILILNDEMRSRILDVFPSIPDSEAKMVHVPVGVDVERFRAVPRDRRAESVEAFKLRVAPLERGRTAAQQRTLKSAVRNDAPREEIIAAIQASHEYPHRQPDEALESAVDEVDWTSARVVSYVGRLLGHKGTHALMAAFPFVLRDHPDAVLLIAGSGPQRELLEIMQHAIAGGHRTLLERIAQWGKMLEGEDEGAYPELAAFFDSMDDAEWEDYIATGRRLAERGRVVFTGYLEHSELSLLFACADVGVFPSIVKEASPLVVPEALASGVVPVGMDQAGMAASLDDAGHALPEDIRPFTRIRPDPEHIVRDIVRNVNAVLSHGGELSDELHHFAAANFDWQAIAARMVADLEAAASHKRIST